ncbi:MAG: hypothetical protein IBV52_08375 [Candidatus Bathyarchaeota archaeon]
MDKKQFKELVSKIDVLIKLTAANVFKDKSLNEGIPILSELGLKPKAIATILGTTPSYVYNVISEAKKLQKKSKAKENKDGELTEEN